MCSSRVGGRLEQLEQLPRRRSQPRVTHRGRVYGVGACRPKRQRDASTLAVLGTGQRVYDRHAHSTQDQLTNGLEERHFDHCVDRHAVGRQQRIQLPLERACQRHEWFPCELLDIDLLRGSSKPLARADADTIGRELRDGLEVADGQLVRRETYVRLPVSDVARHFEVRRYREAHDDIRELGAQVLDDLRHHRVSDRRDGTNREPPCHLLLQLRREAGDFFEADERLLDLRHKNNGFVGRLDASPALLEEWKADDLLQVSDESAHRRLGNPQRIGARADAAMQHRCSERLYHAVGDGSLCHSFAVDAERLRHCQC